MKILWFMKKQLDVALDRTVRLAMIEALGRAGHDATLVTGYRNERPDFGLDGKIRYLASSSLPVVNHWVFTSAVQRELPRLVREIDPDAVILDPWTVVAARSWLKSRAGSARPVAIADVRTLPVGQSGARGRMVEGSFERGVAAMDSLDGVTAITGMMLSALQDDYGLDRELPAGIWGSGVDTRLFDPAAIDGGTRARLREELGVGDAFVIMYHGAISRQRGLGELIAAVRASQDVGPRRVELLLVGDGADRATLLAEAERGGAADRIHYLPPVPNDQIPELIAAADAGVLPFPDLPGWRVSSPIKLFEYLSMERPVVLTDIAAHRAAADGLAAAHFVASNSPADLAAGIEAVASTPSAVIAAAGETARREVAQTDSWDAQAARLVCFLGSLPTSVHSNAAAAGTES